MNTIKEFCVKVVRELLSIFDFYSIIIDKYSMIERMTMNLSKGALNKCNLKIIDHQPMSWEFSAFSQNGEDGIIEFFLSYIKIPNRYFVEIGSSDGLENNSSYLAFAKKYSGIMIEGNSSKSKRAKAHLSRFNWGIKYINSLVNRENIGPLLKQECLCSDPDFFPSISMESIFT